MLRTCQPKNPCWKDVGFFLCFDDLEFENKFISDYSAIEYQTRMYDSWAEKTTSNDMNSQVVKICCGLTLFPFARHHKWKKGNSFHMDPYQNWVIFKTFEYEPKPRPETFPKVTCQNDVIFQDF